MAWKYTSGRIILSGFIVVVILRAIWLLSEVHVATRDIDNNAITREAVRHLCTYNEADISSFIWSHRGHHSDLEVDASKEAVEALLKAGIRNFDVDVSCKTVPNSDSCEFVIAHPSLFADKEKLEQRKHVQALTAFLDQIFTYSQGENEIRTPGTSMSPARPLITLEMKFTQLAQQVEFVKQVQQSRLAAHIAIIGTDPSVLQPLVPHLTHSGVAAAYRTKPFTTHDYSWPEASYNEWQTVQSGWRFYSEEVVATSFTPVPSPLITIRHARSDALNKAESTQQILSDASSIAASAAVLDREVSVPPGTQTIQIQTERRTERKFLQIYMPDVKLLKHQLLWQNVADRIKQVNSENNQSVVSEPESSGQLSSGNVLSEVVGAAVSSISSGFQSSSAGSAGVLGVIKRDAHSIVVVWVVDTVSGLWDALGKGVDGVISNKPLMLLAEVMEAHARYCRVPEQ